MTIKKTPMKVRPAGAKPAAGNGAVADRFKLDAPAPSKGVPAGKGATVAAIAGLVALVVAGILTYVLWQHWDFLMPA